MFDFILRLRARPLAYRRKVAFWSAASITAFITFIWVLSLSIRFDDVAASSNKIQASGPFETFIGQVRTGGASLKDSLGR